jgi:hypothetical protein
LIVRRDILLIFNYLGIEETSTLPLVHENKITATELWCNVDSEISDTSVSGPFFCLGSTRFTFQSDNAIRGLAVNDICDEQRVEEVACLENLWWRHYDGILGTPGPTITCGYNKAAIIDSRFETSLASYSWSDYELCAVSYQLAVHLERECFVGDDRYRHLKPLMDEMSGRVVIPATIRTRRHLVWDFSLLYR